MSEVKDIGQYLRHDANCYWQRGGDYCTCGLDKAIAKLRLAEVKIFNLYDEIRPPDWKEMTLIADAVFTRVSWKER